MSDYPSVIRIYNSLLEDEINERKCTNIILKNIPLYPTIGNNPKKPDIIGFYIYKEELRWYNGKKLCCKHKKFSPSCYFCKYSDDNVFENSSNTLPDGYWKSLENKKKYIGWLGDKLGFVCYEDWYNIEKKDFHENKGSGLLSVEYFKKHKSIKQLVYDVFPDYKWLPFMFTRVEKGWWDIKTNHYIYMDWLGEKLGYTKLEHWYNISFEILCANYGKCLYRKYGDAMHKLVLGLYPEYKWFIWKFNTVGNGVWKDEKILKEYMLELQKELKLKTPEDWYNITRDSFEKFYGISPVTRYGIVGMLKYLYPHYQWEKDKFIKNNNYNLICNRIQEIKKIPTEHLEKEYNKSFYNFIACENKRMPNILWNNKDLKKITLKWLGKKLGYTKIEDWYTISKEDFKKNELVRLLVNNKGGHVKLIMSIFNNLLEWKFVIVPHNFWDSIENRKKYINWLGETLGYITMEDWYNINGEILCANNGSSLLNRYNGSPSKVVISLFPDYNWLEWKFGMSPLNFWKNKKNQKKYMDWLGKELGYTTMVDWYNITQIIFSKNYGSGLLNQYNNSPINTIGSLFPDYNWLEWKFRVTRPHFWKDKKNQKKYINWLGKKLGYTTMEDWYKISAKNMSKNHGSGLLNQYNSSPAKIVMTLFPDHKWVISKFKKNYSAGQIEWAEFLKISIPDMRHILNNDDGEYKIPSTKYLADGFSKKENTIFEYHGDEFHGNPNLHEPTEMSWMGKTYGELWANTQKKQKVCENIGYKFYYIWECDWIRGKKAVKKLQQKWKKSR